MKTIGLIGGMSWESTVSYYRVMNTVVKEKMGGLNSAKCILYSVNFQEIEECQSSGDWEKSGKILSLAAQGLERSGADFIVICTNTMHKVAGRIQADIGIPILHIAEATADELIKNKITHAALLGTRYTMEQDFYKSVLARKGIKVAIPEEEDRIFINGVIYNELCVGAFSKASKDRFLDIMGELGKSGAQGVILGCTEIGLMVRQEDTDIPLFDTAYIHAKAAALRAME